MILELVDESRLLIILSPEDMEDYQLTFDSLDWQNGHSRSVIKEFLRMACRQKGFCPGDSRLLIEAVPDEEGCVLLVTMLPEEKAKRKVYRIKENQPSLTPFLFRFDQAENLLAAVDRVYHQFYHPQKAACSSRLYPVSYTHLRRNRSSSLLILPMREAILSLLMNRLAPRAAALYGPARWWP